MVEKAKEATLLERADELLLELMKDYEVHGDTYSPQEKQARAEAIKSLKQYIDDFKVAYEKLNTKYMTVAEGLHLQYGFTGIEPSER